MPAESKYVDSCCVILMIDRDDTHRDGYGCCIRNPSFTFSLSKGISKESADFRDRTSDADALKP